MKPLVSIIIPAFNAETTLCACLDSVLAQTYSRLEILLVDDGSKDGTGDICEEYAGKDDRVVCVRRENGGLSAARNTGLERCSGELVAFVDSDDIVTPDHIELLYACMPKKGRGVSVTNLTPFKRTFSPAGRAYQAKNMKAVEAVCTIFYQGEFDTCAPGKLYDGGLWDGVRFPEGFVHEDLPTIYKVLLRAENVCYVRSETYGYRYSAIGLNNSKTTSKKIKTLGLVEAVVSEIDASHPELSLSVRCFFVSFCFHLLLNVDESLVTEKETKELEKSISRYRSSIIRDPSARKRTKLACLLSYGGYGLVRFAFRFSELVA